MNLVLELLIRAKDAASGVVTGISDKIRGTGTDANAATDDMRRLSTVIDSIQSNISEFNGELSKINATQKLVDQFRDLKTESVALGQAVTDAKAKTTELGKQFAESTASAKRLSDQFEASKSATQSLRDQQIALKKAIADSKDETARLKKEIADSENPTKELTDKLAAQQKTTQSLREQQVELRKSIAESRTETAKASSEYSTAAKSTAALGKEFETAKKGSKNLSDQQQQLTIRLQQLRQKLSDAGVGTKNLGQASAALGREKTLLQQRIVGLNTSLSNNKQKLAALASEAKKAAAGQRDFAQSSGAADTGAARLGGSIGGLVARLTTLAATYLSLRTLKEALFAVLDTGGDFELLEKRIRQTFDSTADADKAVESLRQLEVKVPGATKAFLDLKNFGLDPLDGSLNALINQSAKLGGSQETLSGIVLAVGQAWSKEKLQQEEALQLIERGVPVWQILANAMGKSVAELQKLSSEGKLGRQEIKLLIDEIGRTSAGSIDTITESWNGLVTQLSGRWRQFLDLIAKSGTLDFFKRQVDDLLTSIEQAADNGELQKIAKQISDFFVDTGQAIKDTIGFIRDYSGAIKTLITIIAGAKLAQFAAGLKSIGTAASGEVAGGLGAATTKASALSGALAKGKSIVSAGVYGALVGEIVNVIDKLGQWYDTEVKLDQAEETLAENHAANIESLKQQADALELNIEKLGDNERAIVSAIEARRAEIDATQGATNALRDYDAEVAAAAAAQVALVGSTGLTIVQMTGIGAAAESALQQFRGWSDGSVKGIESVSEGIRKLSDVELEKMRQSLQTAFDTGINKTQELQSALDQLNVERIDRAFAELGVTSQRSMDEAAASARQAFELIRDSGLATTEDIAAAYAAYAEKAIEANHGVADAALTVEAANYNIKISASEAGQAIVTNMQDAIAAYESAQVAANSFFETQAAAAQNFRDQQLAFADAVQAAGSPWQPGANTLRSDFAGGQRNNAFVPFSQGQQELLATLSPEGVNQFNRAINSALSRGASIDQHEIDTALNAAAGTLRRTIVDFGNKATQLVSANSALGQGRTPIVDFSRYNQAADSLTDAADSLTDAAGTLTDAAGNVIDAAEQQKKSFTFRRIDPSERPNVITVRIDGKKITEALLDGANTLL